MKVLVVSATYPEPPSFGLPKDTLAVHYFAKQWVRDGHEVMVIHPFFNRAGNLLDCFRIHRLGIRHSCVEGVNVVFGASQIFVPHSIKPLPFQERCLAKRIKKHIHKYFGSYTPDVVSVHFPYVLGEFVKSLFDSEIPSFAVFHGTDVRQILSLHCWDRLKWAKHFNTRYARFGFRAPILLEKCCDGLLDRAKATIVLSGLDDALISDENRIIEKSKHPHNEGEPLSIVFAGKLVKQKRIDFVLQALSLIKDEIPFVFYIVGDGEELDYLKLTTEILGLNNKVVFVGRVGREELSRIMFNSDIFVMMSINETLGLVYLEAMAQGCVPIGSKGEGIDGIIINEENGFLCDPFSVEDVAGSIKMIYSLPQNMRERYILNAYHSVNNMTEKKMAEYYMSVLKRVANIND